MWGGDAADRPRGARRLLALALAGALAAGGIGCATMAASSLETSSSRELYPTVEQLDDYSYVLGSYDARRAAGYNTQLVLGSSELYPAPGVLFHPATMLAGDATGVDAMVLGRPGCSDVWQAVEVGALAGDRGVKRVVLVPSLLWFTAGRNPQSDYPGIFSQGAYDAFMAQRHLSDRTKRAATERLRRYRARKGLSGMLRRGSTRQSRRRRNRFTGCSREPRPRRTRRASIFAPRGRPGRPRRRVLAPQGASRDGASSIPRRARRASARTPTRSWGAIEARWRAAIGPSRAGRGNGRKPDQPL